jgi:gamma-glutamylputrescine oxidase
MVVHPQLTSALDCDVCVVGAGYTGLSAALHLAERGFSVVLLEAKRVGWGASGRNGGQLGSGQRRDQWFLEMRLGKEQARRLWDLAEEAKVSVKGRIAQHQIECDLSSGVLHVAHKERLAGELWAYADHLRDNYDYQDNKNVSAAELADMLASDHYYGATLDLGAGHLHPLNYALGLARAAREAGVKIFERSPVRDIIRQATPVVRTADGAVHASFVVIACNGYLAGLLKPIRGFIMPINNYILATEPLGKNGARALIRDNVAVADTRHVINYFRLSADHRLLFGGGETYSMHFPADIKRFVRKHMLRVFPQLRNTGVDYAWGGTLAVTVNRLPSFGRLQGDIYYAQGFSGHGVALTGLAGKLIAEAVSGTAERFDVFAGLPTPRFPGGILLRWPLLVLGMLYYSLRDRL